MARTSNTVLIKSDEIQHPCLALDFREKIFSLVTLSMMLLVGSFKMAFIKLRQFSLIPNLLRIFIMNGCSQILFCVS